jgi:hypothetical protein
MAAVFADALRLDDAARAALASSSAWIELKVKR